MLMTHHASQPRHRFQISLIVSHYQTFFSMVFFKVDTVNGHPHFSVNSYWWLYLVATISLTIMVGLAWYYWLKMKPKTRPARKAI